ncbi:importin-13-like isoform X1 [Acanthaster planci]|uniref:Importin-13 n=1 Tax=Acanthaster planci TaxID=133434 RepID=A0A8B7Z7U5_ACAPL|nr:importin-13-like isoform X1 [Acanthaster planci]XP_022101729.1 importin-13-like isoform X1 [Acanthaster planci]
MASSSQSRSDSSLDVNVENIEKAIHQLYYDPHPGVKDTAQRWLLVAQRSQHAWQFSWTLLSPDKATEVQYFGASALHTKISRYWAEMHPEQYDILRTQLFRQIFTFGTGARIVLTRLCVALSSFALNTMPEVWPDAVKGIIDTFQQTDIPQLDATHRCTALLELLTVLPEEFHTAPLPQSRRGTVRHELENGLQHVLPLIKTLLGQQDSPDAVRLQALKCFSSWVQLNVPLPDIEPITEMLFQLLLNHDLFDLCIDSLISVVCQPVAYKYPTSIRKVIKQVLQLQDHLASAVRDKDMDVVQGICRLAVSLGENNSKILLESEGEDRQHAVEFTNLIIGFTALPGHYPVDETISNIPFGFWYILQDDIVSSDQEEFREYVRVFAPVYMHLVEVMLTKVQYPPDEEYSTWNAEEKEHFRCYRQDIGDTLMYCYTLLREPLLNHLYAILSRIQEQQLPWQQVEACLFAFRSIAEGGDYGDDQCVSDLLQLLAQVNMSHTTLASTALYMLGAYSEWLADAPEALRSVIPVLLTGLNDPELAAPATMSLKDICCECRKEIKPYAETILNASQEVLRRNTIKARESVRLMSIVGLVLSTLSLQEILSYLQLILTPQLQILESAINEQPTPVTKSTILLKINMLSNLCSTLDLKRPDRPEEEQEGAESMTVKRAAPAQDEPQPVLLILQQTLPILQNLLSVWISDVGVVEAVCELLRRASRTLLDDMQPMIPQLAELVATIYNALPQSAVLDLAKQIIILFGDNEEVCSAVGAMFVQLCSKTVSLFPAQAQDQTDVVETFMAVCAILLKKQSSVFVREGCNPAAIFQCGLMAVTLPENPTIRSSCNFFMSFISQSENLPVLSEALAQHGRSLLELVLKAIGGAAPRTVIESLADVLFTLNKHCFSQLSGWLPELMLSPDLSLPRVTKDQREQFAKTVLRNRAQKRQLRDLVKEFSLMCRGLHGTEYAEY